MTERFILSKAVSAGHPMQRIPGQVPTKERMALLRTMQDSPPQFRPAMLLQQGGAYLSPASVVNGLGLEKAQESSWIKFLETNLRADTGLTLRKAVMAKATGDRLPRQLAKVILERSLLAYRDMRKSMVAVVTPDELLKAKKPPKEYREEGATSRSDYADPKNYKYPLHTESNVRAAISYFSKPKNAGVYSTSEQKAIWGRIKRAAKKHKIEISEESGPPSVELKKAEAKGGRYFKRVPTQKGGYRYFYDEGKYKASSVAHVGGEEASHTAIRSGIQKFVEIGGENGCELKQLQPLVKRYGHKMVAKVLDDDVKKNGKLRFKKGRLYSGAK